MDDFPKWTAFFHKLATRVEGKSPTDESILQKLVEKMGGEVQMAVEREDYVPLYDDNVVAPLIMKETDIPPAAVATRWLQRPHGAVKATVCPLVPTLSLPTVSLFCLYCVHSSRCMSIYMHAIAQRLYPSTVCVYSIPSAPSYPWSMCAPTPYYVILLLILLFCHPTILFTRYYLSISMFPSLLSVLSCFF